jgi:addiction module RelE/StbE family toxin
VRWTSQAVDDLASIRAFIERDSPRYGRLVVQRLLEATGRLEAFPHSGRVVPELQRDEMREIVLGDYRIVYRLETETPVILTVFRSSRLLPRGIVDP